MACAPYPTGLRRTPAGSGPTVIIDWDAEPLPEIPLPNDLATRADPTSITGLRLNISEDAPTEMERRARRKINGLTGFGVYAPFTVSFDSPLDLDEITRRHQDDGNFADDAFFLINVDPSSPDYLQPVRLEVGHGRFPQDLDQTDRYFPNDPRADSPALLFETEDEDSNQNGILEPWEDTDNDGILDKPNVYPEGGDPREDLMTWYERETNTLIIRPVMPLREETRYAVILTERLVGLEGDAVRSPWEYVHHLRQTEALAPALHALPEWGVDMDDLAFGWTFTTGRVTGDLVDVRRGMDGEGPWPWLATAFPAGVLEALVLHEDDALEDEFRLPVAGLIEPVGNLGLFGDSADVLQRAYSSFSTDIVGGSYITPYLLVDVDDGGLDDTDEWWKLDPMNGTMVVGPQRVPFTCVLPKATEDNQPPFDVVLFGHGYGSSRFDMFGFSWAMNRVGKAACAIDYPGHGPTINPDELELVEAILKGMHLMPFLDHLKDARYRDVDNDGIPDSGADQWIADSFHTRDMVRQAAVDWSQLIKSLQACGTGEMDKDGDRVMACDWDEDGTPDIGGRDAKFYLVGGSLGGINTAVTAAIEPNVTASAPIVGAGGLMDIGIRSPLTGVVEAVIGRLITPLIIGTPDDAGGLVLSQHVISGRHDATLPFARLPSVPGGGEILVENLVNGEERLFRIPDDGTLRVPIPGDAADPTTKRILAGLPHQEDPGIGVYTVEDNIGLGDELRITVWDATGAEVAQIDTFEEEVLFEGVTYLVNSPLVVASEGLGHLRGSPSLRRLASFTGMIIEGGDPIAYAPAYFERPFEALGGQATNVLVIPTPGDMIVAVNAEIALARAAGLVNFKDVDPRYGMTVDQWLIDREVVRGLEQHGPWVDASGSHALFDPDDLDEGLDGYGVPSDAPLRVTRDTDAGVSGMRIPYVSTTGSHGFGLPDPTLAFDINTFAIHQVARYFETDGQVLTDDQCMEDHSCSWLRPFDEEEGR
jgi:pimeloyl-ACP methyl ester carboxylesterase